jgi:DNA-binding MarR family transcriptional regulator
LNSSNTNIFGTLNEPLEKRVVTGLLKIGLAMKSQAWQGAGIKGITPTQAQIITLLSQSPIPMRLSEISKALAVTPATASDAVTTLVDKGLVQKGKAANDARAMAITLTDRGKREADEVAGWPDFLMTAVEELSEEEQKIFFRSLLKMIRILQQRGQIPVSQMCVTCRFFQPHVHQDPDRPHHCAFVDAPFGDRDLRLECPDHFQARPETVAKNWQKFRKYPGVETQD